MQRQINFVVPSQTERKSIYQSTIYTIIDPIRIYLPKSTVLSSAVINAVNIHFFNEKAYRDEKMKGCDGIHVFMSHGMGDKKWRDGSKVKHFDYVCVSGPSWIQKMIRQGIPEEKLLTTGFAKLDPIFQGKIKKATNNKKKTILYAPTHIGSGVCTSYPAFRIYLSQFPDAFDIACSAHPYHKKTHIPTLQALADADVVISDGSSMIYEAMALGIPVVFPDWLVKDAILSRWPDTFTGQIYREKIGYHADDFDQLVSQIFEAAEKKLSDKEKAFIEGILPSQLRGHSGRTAAKALKEIANRQP